MAYQWGASAPATRQIAGKLLISDALPGQGGPDIWNLMHRVDAPISTATLKLQNLLTGAIYRKVSDQNGSFSFDLIPNGTYVLHVEGGTAPEPADFLIQRNDNAPRNMAEGGMCGGAYLELRQPRANLPRNQHLINLVVWGHHCAGSA